MPDSLLVMVYPKKLFKTRKFLTGTLMDVIQPVVKRENDFEQRRNGHFKNVPAVQGNQGLNARKKINKSCLKCLPDVENRGLLCWWVFWNRYLWWNFRSRKTENQYHSNFFIYNRILLLDGFLFMVLWENQSQAGNIWDPNWSIPFKTCGKNSSSNNGDLLYSWRLRAF